MARAATHRFSATGQNPEQRVAYITIAVVLVFAAAYLNYVGHSLAGVSLDTSHWVLLIVKTLVELIASAFGLAFLISAIAFLLMRETDSLPVTTGPDSSLRPPVGLLYLCCDDVDWTALESLTRLSYAGELHLVIHDDSRTDEARGAVDEMAHRLRSMRPWTVHVLRRPDKSGGKAGAVNYALSQTEHLFHYFVLCDNDSTVLMPDTIERALACMDDRRVGGVQFRSVPVHDPAYCGANRRLAESIGAFHAFLAPAARYGWMPFIGHNALLRTQAVRQVGGFTPGFFSDDLDLTVRLNLEGFRIAYAPEIAMGEKHPPSYTAFRKRSYKWAYGCVQTLRAHSWNVLRSRRFSLAEKLSFFQFAGFYCLQSAFLAYLCFNLLVVPFGVLGSPVPDLIPSLIVGVVLVGVVYAPLLSFYAKFPAHRRRGWIGTLILCGLVYGGTDFSVVRGVVDAFRRKQRAWIPTNGVTATAVDPLLFLEAAFAVVLLTVPLLYLPELLYLPCWFLFAGKFLFAPGLSLLYRDQDHDALTATLPHAAARDRRPAVLDAGPGATVGI